MQLSPNGFEHDRSSDKKESCCQVNSSIARNSTEREREREREKERERERVMYRKAT